jgi:hypothetical protein
MRVFYLMVIISFFWGCDHKNKSIKKLTVDAFEKRHQQNIETLTVLCPMKENAMQCLKMYDIEYRTFEGKKYLYEITYK